VVTLNLPAGVYAVFAKAQIANNEGDRQFAQCRLSTGESIEVRLGGLGQSADVQYVGVQDLLTLSTSGSVILHCSTVNGFTRFAKITAVMVAVLHG
jgi:hypothetical protein